MTTTMTTTQYRVVRDGAGIVSTHRTLSGACRSLARQREGAHRQGGWSDDYIQMHTVEDGWQRLDLAIVSGGVPLAGGRLLRPASRDSH